LTRQTGASNHSSDRFGYQLDRIGLQLRGDAGRRIAAAGSIIAPNDNQPS
jgi:hypothetical protein